MRALFGLAALSLLLGCRGCREWDERREAVIRGAFSGDAGVVHAYLDGGGDPRLTVWRSSGGRMGSSISLLEAAVASGSWETVEPLLVDDAARDAAFAHSLQRHKLEVAARLAAQGAKVSGEHNLVFRIVDFPTFYAVPEGSVVRALELLRESGYRFTAEDLGWVVSKQLLGRAGQGQPAPPWVEQAVWLIWETGPDVRGDSRLLEMAIDARMEPLALKLIAAGSEVNPPAADGGIGVRRSPLAVAIYANSPKVVEALLAAGADPAQAYPDWPRRNAVQVARELGDRAEIEALLCKAAPALCSAPAQ